MSGASAASSSVRWFSLPRPAAGRSLRRSAYWSRCSRESSSNLLVWAVIGLVARLATGEAGDSEASRGRSRSARWRTSVASRLLGIAGVPPFGERATSSTSEATPRLVVPRAVAPPQHVALSAPRLLEGSVVVIPISRPLLAPHALLVDPLSSSTVMARLTRWRRDLCSLAFSAWRRPW
jgi:hypothetical protein